jgi:SAM-dependent methyltransferase
MTSPTDAYFWDKISQKYSNSPIADQAAYEKTLNKTRTLLRQHDTVLELGCGTGGTGIHLADAVNRYLATDISSAMIDIAQAKLKDPDTTPTPAGLEFRVATADTVLETEKAKPGQFNAILAFNYLHLVRDLDGTLRVVHSLLAPGGMFISKTPCIRDMTFGMFLGPVLPLARMVGLAPFVAPFTAEELKNRLEAAGFEVVETEYHATVSKGDTRPYVVAKKRL